MNSGKNGFLGEKSLEDKCYEVNRKDGNKFGCKAVGALCGILFYFILLVFRRKAKN